MPSWWSPRGWCRSSLWALRLGMLGWYARELTNGVYAWGSWIRSHRSMRAAKFLSRILPGSKCLRWSKASCSAKKQSRIWPCLWLCRRLSRGRIHCAQYRCHWACWESYLGWRFHIWDCCSCAPVGLTRYQSAWSTCWKTHLWLCYYNNLYHLVKYQILKIYDTIISQHDLSNLEN